MARSIDRRHHAIVQMEEQRKNWQRRALQLTGWYLGLWVIAMAAAPTVLVVTAITAPEILVGAGILAIVLGLVPAGIAARLGRRIEQLRAELNRRHA